MIPFLENQQDFLALLTGYACFALALTCWFHRHSLHDSLNWKWFALFATVAGLDQWCQIPLSFLQQTATHDIFRLGMGVAVAFCLYEFGFRCRVWVRSDYLFRWLIFPLAVPVIIAAILEIRVALFVANLAWALPAGLLATLAFHRAAQRVVDGHAARWLRVLRAGMVCFCVTVGVEATVALLRVAILDAESEVSAASAALIVLLRLLTIAVLVTGGVRYANRSARLASPLTAVKTHPILKALLLIVAAICVVGGWLATERAGTLAQHHHRKLLRYDAGMAATAIRGETLTTLTGSDADTTNPHYVALKGLFQNMCRLHPELQAVYLMSERRGRWVFLVHSSEDIPPGQPVNSSVRGMAALQDLAYVICSGFSGYRPHRGPQGSWISSYAPILVADSARLADVVGLDYDGRGWLREIHYHRLLGLLLMLSLGLGLGAAYVGQRTAHRIRVKMVAGEVKFRTVFDSATDAICIHDLATGDVLEANRRAYEMMGWHPTDTIDCQVMPFSAHEPPFDNEHAERWINAAVAGEAQHFEWQAVDRNGKKFWIEVTLQKIMVDGCDRLLTVARYIQRRKQAEEELRRSHLQLEQRVSERTAELARAVAQLQADVEVRRAVEEQLRESESRFRALAEADTSGIMIFQDAKFIYANPGAARISGFTRKELCQLDFWAQVHPDSRDMVKQRGEARLRGESVPNQYSLKIICKNGEEKWIHNSAGVIQYGGRPAVVITFFDITAQKEHETELVRSSAQATQARKLESLGAMAGGIAHDFNNLLMGILGNTDLLLAKLPEDSPFRGNAEEIRAAGRRAATIADKMLTCSGSGTFLGEPVDLNRFLLELKPFLVAYSSAEIELAVDLPARLPMIHGDAGQLRQALVNLVTNAVESVGDKPGRVCVRAGATELTRTELNDMQLGEGLKPGFYAFLEVSDTGAGMDAETRNRIFDPFFSTKFVGRGLGLPAVLGVVRSHLGAIRVESGPGKGTAIRIVLPVVGADTPAAPGSSAVPPTPDAAGVVPRATGKILVVDDEEMVRKVVSAILQAKKYEVITAPDGSEALALFARHQAEIGLVIVDLSMPRMMGDEVLRELKKLVPTIPVILTSGYSEGDALRRIERGQLAGFIKKPYRADVLLECVRAILGNPAERR